MQAFWLHRDLIAAPDELRTGIKKLPIFQAVFKSISMG